MTTYKFFKSITCTDSMACSNKIVDRLELALGIKLHADNETDTVNGSVTIIHESGNHNVRVEIYDVDSAPSSDRKSTLKRPAVMPTENQVENII